MKNSEVNPVAMRQRLGNRGTQAWLAEQGSTLPLQARLTVGEPGDIYEQEADRVAETVMNMQEPAMPDEEETKVQAKSLANQLTPLVRRVPEEAVEEEPTVKQVSDLESEYEQAEEAINERPGIQQLDEERGDVYDQLSNIEHQIIATRATSVAGLEVKRRFAERLFDDENGFENRLFRSIYADAVQLMARSVS